VLKKRKKAWSGQMTQIFKAAREALKHIGYIKLLEQLYGLLFEI